MELAADAKQIPKYFPTSTPIVDGFEPLPSGNRQRLGAGEYFFLSGVAILSLIALPIFRRTAISLSSQGIILACLIACLFIPGTALAAAVVAHEAGHLAAAWLSGFRLAPRISATSGRPRPYSRGLLRIGFWTLEPRRLDHLPGRLFLVVLGGPMTSFLLPAVLASAVTVARPSPLAVFCLEVFGATCLLLSVAELLPDMGRGASSDGARLLMLLRKDAFADRWLSLVGLEHSWNADQPPENWDERTIARIIAIDDDSRDAVAARWMGYWWATERQDISSAAKYLEESLAAPGGSSGWLRDRLFLEAAVFQAWFREDLDKAGAWAARIHHRRLTSDQQCRLTIALLWAEGRLFDAWEKLGQLTTSLQDIPASSVRNFSVTNCLEWKTEMESRMLTRAWRALYSTTQQVDRSAPVPEEIAPATAPL
ncbi:MAG TPA: M50 family metallopeptidase [Terriglobales bacterium]